MSKGKLTIAVMSIIILFALIAKTSFGAVVIDDNDILFN